MVLLNVFEAVFFGSNIHIADVAHVGVLLFLVSSDFLGIIKGGVTDGAFF